MLVLSSAWAQEGNTPVATGRARVFGRAVAADGSPWAGATVNLVGRPYPVYLHAGDADEVVVRCDERGRFDAAILPYRRYSAWALAALPNGGARVSKIADEVLPGVPVSLVESDERILKTTVRFENLRALAPWAPLRFRAYCRRWPGTSLARFVELDADEETLLPHLPDSALLEIIGKNGVRLWATAALNTAASREIYRTLDSDHHLRPRLDAERADVVVIPLPDLTRLEIAVTEPRGAPVAGATISIGAQDSSGWAGDAFDCAPAAVTDAKGTATVDLPLYFRPDGSLGWPRHSVHVTAPEHGEVFLRAMGDSQAKVQRDAPKLSFLLPASKLAIRGRLLGPDGHPQSNVELLLYSRLAPFIAAKPFVYRTAEDGTFRIDGLAPSLPCRLTALLPGGSDPVMAEESYLQFVTRGRTGEIDLGTLRPADLEVVELHVTTTEGKADCSWLHIGESAPDGPPTSIVLRTDRKGYARLRARHGSWLAVLATDGLGFDKARIEVKANGENSHRFVLRPGVRVAGIAVDQSDQPIANATVRLVPYGGVAKAGGEWGAFVDGALYTSPILKGIVRTNAEGAFSLAYPFGGFEISLFAWKTLANRQDLVLPDDQPNQGRFLLTDEGVKDLKLVLVPRK